MGDAGPDSRRGDSGRARFPVAVETHAWGERPLESHRRSPGYVGQSVAEDVHRRSMCLIPPARTRRSWARGARVEPESFDLAGAALSILRGIRPNRTTLMFSRTLNLSSRIGQLTRSQFQHNVTRRSLRPITEIMRIGVRRIRYYADSQHVPVCLESLGISGRLEQRGAAAATSDGPMSLGTSTPA